VKPGGSSRAHCMDRNFRCGPGPGQQPTSERGGMQPCSVVPYALMTDPGVATVFCTTLKLKILNWFEALDPTEVQSCVVLGYYQASCKHQGQ
jgi:hypothetical protein